MRTATLLKNNLAYFWRTNLAVVAGVAIAVSVLAGALVVGDSVRASLRDLFLSRLGATDHVITSTSFFREQLADDLQANNEFRNSFDSACPLILFEGVVSHEGRRASGVQVYGVDERFWRFHGREGQAQPLEGNNVFVSGGLVEEVGGAAGDSLLLTIEKPSAIHAESLHGRKDDLGRTIRLTIKGVLSTSELGDFSIRPQQGAARTLFVPLRRLQRDLEQPARVNAILVSGNKAGGGQALEAILKEAFALEDLAVKIRPITDQNAIALESDTAIISDALADNAKATAAKSGMSASGVLTYLANSIRANQREVPYSVVSAISREKFQSLGQASQAGSQLPPLILNEWAASDLGARVGDEVELEYYVWQQEGSLKTEKSKFQLVGITPIAGAAADRNLVPDYPGITGAESIGDWDPPFPMDLDRIRPKDEDYWDRYRATPKAFVVLEDGQRLWQSRYGRLTSLRLTPPAGATLESAASSYADSLRSSVNPLQMGLSVFDVRAEGLAASRGATDFGEYFVYFSFFLVISALMLVGLFFKLGIEQRLREIGILRAAGFAGSKIRNLFLTEGLILATVGSLVGLAGAALYGWLMMYGLRTWWVDAVGTRLLSLHISPTSLIIGGVGGVVAALIFIYWTLRAVAAASPRSLLGGGMERAKGNRRKAKGESSLSRPLIAAIAFGVIGVALLASASLGLIGQVAGFFGAGITLLVAFVCYQSARLRKDKRGAIGGQGWWSVSQLGFRNVTYRPGRSVLCIALIASATFIIVAVDAFRRDSTEASTGSKSGTGGYALLAESVVPLVSDPVTEEGRETLNLFADQNNLLDEVSFTRFRLRPGDDASCLNLYQPRNPRMLAPGPGFVESNRFAFQDSLAETSEEKQNPWLLLEREDRTGAIPVIADANSMTYVLHKKLGDEITIDSGGAEPLRLRLVASLADSVFQGELLMSEKNFTREFPDQEGYRFFLLDVPQEKSSEAAALLEDRLSDYGFDVTRTAERLAGFHRVENTYLSTFQTLGGLGLLLGTLGLATVLLRNVLERRRELALLRAMGYRSSHFTLMVVAENAWLLFCGLLTGAACALIAIAPALLARGGRLPTGSLAALLVLVMVTGLAASLLATVAALRSPLLPALRSE
ncbi:MAG TPA: FtsX-like permease family protein [Blastocatellia bacterium]|nr:FtsX-like permease family protein [Blastocatellia bacterium]